MLNVLSRRQHIVPFAVALAGALLALDLLLWSYLGYRLVSFPENHTGFDTRRFIYLFSAQAAIAVVLLRQLPKPLAIALLLASALCLAGSVLLITHDILLPYDLWLKRGMPERPF